MDVSKVIVGAAAVAVLGVSGIYLSDRAARKAEIAEENRIRSQVEFDAMVRDCREILLHFAIGDKGPLQRKYGLGQTTEVLQMCKNAISASKKP